MDYADFYDIAVYANENWRGKFTPREIANNAYELFLDFQESCKQGKPICSMVGLLENLTEDAYNLGNGCKADEWYTQIIREIAGDRAFIKW